jgi:hypothetical protein
MNIYSVRLVPRASEYGDLQVVIANNSEEAAKLIREKYPQDECADTWYPTLKEIKAEIDRYGVVLKINEVKEPVYVDGFCT